MNRIINKESQSLVLSLCKEIEYIKIRTTNINYSLKTCQNKLLSNRLRTELTKLNSNKEKISKLSIQLFKNNCNDLSLQFLKELSKRSNFIQQI